MRTSLCGALAQASSRRDAAEDALHEAVAAAEATLFPSQKRPAKRAKTTPKLKLEPDDQRGHVLRVTKAGAAAVRKASARSAGLPAAARASVSASCSTMTRSRWSCLV